MGGGGATADNTLTFNDTSEFMYRNSSTKRGGFEGSVGLVTNSTNLDIDGDEEIVKAAVLLSTAERDAIKLQVKTLNDCVIANFCAERADLYDKARTSWDRAITLYDDTRADIQAELDNIKAEGVNMVCLNKLQWERTAGSSLNTTVLLLQADAEVALTQKLAALLAERIPQLRQAETQAMAQAFTDMLNSRMEPAKLALAHMGTLYGILRGSTVSDTTNRSYVEGRDEDSRQFTLMGKFFHDVTDIADNSGAYAAELDDAFGASTAIAGVIPAA